MRAVLLVLAMILTTILVSTPAQADDPGPSGGESGPADVSKKAKFYDSRQDPSVERELRSRAAESSARPKVGVAALRRELGDQAIVSIDPVTGTARSVSRLNGFLTPPDRRPPATIALEYVQAHPDVFGLDAAAIGRLTLRRDYRDIVGTHHLSFIQTVDGVPVFANGIQANVTRNGQLINVIGSPVANLPNAAASPVIGAEAARVAANVSVDAAVPAATATAEGGPRQTTVFSNGDRAELTYFVTTHGPQLSWQTLTAPNSRELYTSVVDAVSGKVLYRRSLVNSDTGSAWDYYPGADKGGAQRPRNFTARGWLPSRAPWLAGNVAHVYTDVNDDNAAQASEEITPSGDRRFIFPFVAFNSANPGCSTQFQCSWDPTVADSWQTNRAQNGVQVLYFLGKFHDHLRRAPIGFTRSAGNFEAVDGDAVLAENMDGADTADGLPDVFHTDNANMATPPDGLNPRMQMYLFRDAANPDDPFLPTNGGDEADIVYHEYTHGLSNRLVVDVMGNSTLGNFQAGSMGEAWSDWYALDFLNNEGFLADTRAPGEVFTGEYVGAGQNIVRTQPIDCPVGTTSPACPGTPGAGPGGYTYGDFGNILGFPQVHTDGEIWAETLWDLRDSLGSRSAESLVTRAMELSPANPSFLDMRNAILLADQVVDRGSNNSKIWQVFAARGMGWFAGAVDGDDTTPVEDFSLPPRPGTPTGSLSGTVTDQDAATPLKGAVVGFSGHASGFPGDYVAITDADGHYSITGILPGTYPAVFARSEGFDRKSTTLSIGSRASTLDWTLRRDWAAIGGGGRIVDFDGPDFTLFGCGPTAAIDQSLRTGWSSTTGPDDSSTTPLTPKSVTVALPRAIDIAELSVDPGNTCGDDQSAATAGYRLETSTNGAGFAIAAEGEFGEADRGHLNAVPFAAATGKGVTHVRFTMLSPQLPPDTECPGPFAGCFFMDLSELAVYGSPTD